jgi:hypothetical protein
MSIRPEPPPALRREMIADDLRKVTQAANREHRAQGPYAPHPAHTEQPFCSPGEWWGLTVTVGLCVALIVLGFWKLTEIIGGAL